MAAYPRVYPTSRRKVMVTVSRLYCQLSKMSIIYIRRGCYHISSAQVLHYCLTCHLPCCLFACVRARAHVGMLVCTRETGPNVISVTQPVSAKFRVYVMNRSKQDPKAFLKCFPMVMCGFVRVCVCVCMRVCSSDNIQRHSKIFLRHTTIGEHTAPP